MAYALHFCPKQSMTRSVVCQSHHDPAPVAVDAPTQSQSENSVCSTAVTIASWMGGTCPCTLEERNRPHGSRRRCCCHFCCTPTTSQHISLLGSPLMISQGLQASQHKGCCCSHKWTVPQNKERVHTQGTGTSALPPSAGSTELTSQKERQAGTPHTTGNTHCNTNVGTHYFWGEAWS